jgi:hypothetical protein
VKQYQLEFEARIVELDARKYPTANGFNISDSVNLGPHDLLGVMKILADLHKAVETHQQKEEGTRG